jgi:hypothetical protein
MERSAGCLGAGFAKGGANSWALDLQTVGTLWLQAGCGWGVGYGVVEADAKAPSGKKGRPEGPGLF